MCDEKAETLRGMKIFELGDTVTDRFRVVALRWHAAQVDPSDDGLLGRLAKGPGLYAIEGYHDSVPTPAVLYIGKADRQAIRARAPRSLRDRVWWKNDKIKATRLYSDVWDVTLRWAELKREAIPQVERLLISAHSPPFNSQLARRDLPATHGDLIVVNTGEKGRLMPTVFGGYFVPARFPWF